MSRRKTPVSSPLPQLNGIDPVRLKLPEVFPAEFLAHCQNPLAPTIADYLIARFYSQRPKYVLGRFERSEIVDEMGEPLAENAPYRAGQSIWYHRELSPEPDVPTDLPVLFEDEWILAVDKPHFLATTPRGMFVANTALTLLRVTHELPDLSPAHRLDRPTAGVLVFAKVPPARGPLQKLFQNRHMKKEYEAIAPLVPRMLEGETVEVRSHLDKQRAILQVIQHSEAECKEKNLPINAISSITLKEALAAPDPGELAAVKEINPQLNLPSPQQQIGLYSLRPHTGKTHQLRAHMLAIKAPIYGDTMYPELINTYPDAYDLPLQLLARNLEFTHPFTGKTVSLTSARQLRLR